MKDSIIIVGGFHEIIELAQENKLKIHGLIDNNKSEKYMDYPVLGTDNDIDYLYHNYSQHQILITPDNPILRRRLYNMYMEGGFSFISLISKDAKISSSVNIEIGTIIQYGVKVSCESIIGRFCKLNYNCNITHNVTVGDFTTIAPNAVILGNVKIGNNCYVGASATILPNIVICDNVVIGAGAVVTKDIYEEGNYIGMPATKSKLKN